jgi:hypothetical protein
MIMYVGIARTSVRHIPGPFRGNTPDNASAIQIQACKYRAVQTGPLDPTFCEDYPISVGSRQTVFLKIISDDSDGPNTICTLAERYQDGVRLRRKTSREKHADLRGATDRDAVAILRATDRTRVPELVPVRYERMLANPFAFLRGAAAVMAEDLRRQPTTGIPVQACGDCHLMNFGAFATPEQNILFDINDFDETLLGVDFTADLKRLAASVAVAVVRLQR